MESSDSSSESSNFTASLHDIHLYEALERSRTLNKVLAIQIIDAAKHFASTLHSDIRRRHDDGGIIIAADVELSVVLVDERRRRVARWSSVDATAYSKILAHRKAQTAMLLSANGLAQSTNAVDADMRTLNIVSEAGGFPAYIDGRLAFAIGVAGDSPTVCERVARHAIEAYEAVNYKRATNYLLH